MTRVAPAKVRKEAKLGLMLHKKWKRGGTAVGVARAVQLYSGKAVSDQTIKRMYSYFQRHQHDRLDKDGSDGKIPGKGYIAWLLWGGDSGRKWAEAEYKKIKKKQNPTKEENPLSLIDEIKTNDEVLQLKNFIQKIDLKKKNPRKPWKYVSKKSIKSSKENKSSEHPFIWVRAKIIEVAILTALKASGENGLSLLTLSEAVLYIMGQKHDSSVIKRLNMTVLRIIDDWRDRKLDYVSVAEPISSSPAHSLMKRKPSSVYIIRSKGVEHLEQIKTELTEALKIADETKDMDSLIYLIERERPKNKQNPLSLIARGIDERPASAYDREELKLGIKTELEHTEDAIIASKIAKDHLDEDPHYYSKLIEMESKMKNPSKSSEDRILKALRFAMIDYAILSALKGAGIMGLPHFAIEQKVNEIVRNDNQKSMTVSIAERLKFYIENSYVFKRSLSPESFKENFPKAGRVSDRAYCIDSEGLKLLEKIEELFHSLGHSINDLKDSEKLKASFKQNNPSKDNEMKPEEYFEILGAKMKNPITSSFEKSEEYLPIVQKVVSKTSKGTDAWIDETTGDILVGTMAFDEDRSFDDVLIRIKTSGQIKEGESVDKPIRKSVQDLMKKIHMVLAEYVARKPNPSKEISEIKTNFKKLNKFFGLKKRNPSEKDIPYLNETLLSSDILLEYIILSIIKASGNSGAPLILIEKSVFEILMGGQEISEAGKGLNESAKDKLETSLYVKIMRMINEWKRKKLNFIYERSPAKENELYSLLQKRPSDSKYYVIESDGIQYLNSIKLVIQQIIDKEEKIKDQQSIIELLSSYREKIIKMKNKGISRKIPEIDKVQEIVEEKIESKKSNPVPAGVDPEEFDDLVKKLKKRKDVDNPYALANWILKQKNPTAYEKLLKQLQAKGVDDPRALAAWIGRQKYGKEEFQRRAAAGRRKKSNPSSDIKKDFDEILKGKSHD